MTRTHQIAVAARVRPHAPPAVGLGSPGGSAGIPDALTAAVGVVLVLTLIDSGGLAGLPAVAGTLVLVGGAGWAMSTRGSSPTERRLMGAAIAFSLLWTVLGLWRGTGSPGVRGLALGPLALAAAVVLSRRLAVGSVAAVGRWITRGFAVMAALGIVGYLQRSPGWAQPATGVWRAAGTLSYANGFGLLLGLAAPFVAVRSKLGTTEVERRWARATLVLLAAAITLTMSRGAAIALVAGLITLPASVRWRAVALVALGSASVLPLVASATSDRPNPAGALALIAGVAAVVVSPPLSRRVRILLALACAAGLVGLGMWATSSPEVLENRLAASHLDARSPELKAGLDQVASAPIWGVGPERAMVGIDPSDGHEYWTRFLHNEYLQVAAGAGLVGVLMLGLLGVQLVRFLRPTRQNHVISTALILGVGGLFDFSWHFLIIPMSAGLLLGLNQEESELT